MSILCEFVSRPTVIALLVSTIGGMPVLFGWAATWHWYANRCDGKSGLGNPPSERDLPTVIIGGIFERGLITMLALWLPSEVGVIVAGWIAVKAAGSWGQVSLENLSGRRRYFVHLMGSMGSMFWALAWGIWGMPPKSV